MRASHLLRFLLPALVATPALRAQDVPLLDVADALIESRIPTKDDADELAGRLLAVARENARSPASVLLVESVGRLIAQAADPRAIAEGLTELIAVPDVHGSTRHVAMATLRPIALVLGDHETASRLDPYADFARGWIAIGPFGDDGDFYDGVPFPPELRFPGPDEELAGRFGPVVTRVVERRPDERDVDLGPRVGDARGCNYGLHQVRADAATPCYVEIVTRGSFELFLNGDRVHGVDRIAERVGQLVFVPVTLRAGVNHVLVKTTLEDRHEVGLRYVDARGRTVKGVSELAPDSLREVAAAEPDAPPAPAPFVDPLEALVRAARRAEGEAATVLDIAVARLAFELGFVDVGDEFLFALTQAPPGDDPRLAVALSDTWQNARDVPAEIRDGEARRLLESVADRLPGHHYVTMRRADLLRGDDRIEDAIHLVRAAVDAGAAGPQTWGKLVDLLDALDADAEAENARRAWLDASPLSTTPRLVLARERARDGDPAGALAMLEEGLRLLPGHRGLLAQARALAVDLGDRERALAFLERLHDDDPDSLAALRERAAMLRELGDVEGAVDAWRRCAAHADADATALREIGIALWRAGAAEPSRDALRRSLGLRPSQHDLRRMLGRLDGTDVDDRRIARFRASRTEIDDLVSGFEAGDRERAAPSTLLLDRMVVEFQPDGSYVQEVHQVRRINDLRGVAAHEEATAAARADAVLRLRTIGADGRSYVPKRVGGNFAMPRLEPGAFVEELWQERFDAPGADPWRGPSFLFRGEDEAFLQTELVLVLPPDHPGTARMRGFPHEPEQIELDAGYRALRFVLHDVPRLPPEERTPPIEELVPYVVYGEDRSTGARARYAHVAAIVRTRGTPWVARTAASVVQGIDGDLARAEAIHRWVHENIPVERGSPDPTATLLRRQGPRFFLEVAMLRAARVPVRDAAAMDEDEAMSDAPPPLFVGEEDFRVPAALVEPRDGPPLWLFADAPRHAPLGFVAASRAGAAALVAGGDGLIRLPDATERAPGWTVTGRIELGEDGSADFAVFLELQDAPGYALAQQVRDLDANRRTLVGRSVGAQLFEGWTVMGSELEPPEPGQRFRASLQLRRRGALQPAGRFLQLPLPVPRSEMFQRYGDPGPRELPMRLSGTTLERWDVLVDGGDAHRLVALPDDLRIAHAMLDYELTFERDGNGVRIRRHFALRPGTIPPERFGEWVHVLRTIDRAEQARIEFAAR